MKEVYDESDLREGDTHPVELHLPLPSKETKFDEEKYIEEVWDYISSTYNQHYSREQFQAMEFIIDGGHGVGFCVGDILKYAQRYGKKGTPADARKDIMKIIHYAMFLLYVHDKENRNESAH